MSNGHASPASPHPGDPHELGGYRVPRRLGRGGMGTVYLAQTSSGAQVALKVIHPDLADDESFRLRFAREVASARRVARFSTAFVRVDGAQAWIRKNATDTEEGETLARSTSVDGFRSYPEPAEDSRGQDAEQVTNNVKLACEYAEDEDGGPPSMELALWINDEPVLNVVDESPVPAAHHDEEVIRRYSLFQDTGTMDHLLVVLYEGFQLNETVDD